MRHTVLGLIFVCLFSSLAWGTIAIDATVSTDKGTASTTVATPAFSTSSGNELLLAFIATDYRSGANTTVKSISGGGLTWVLVVRTNVQSGSSEIWRAFATNALTGVTVTATLSQSVASSITVMSYTGVDSSGVNGAGAIGSTGTGNANRGAPTASLTTTRDNSLVVGVGNDFDNAVARTVGPNQVLVHQYLPSTGDTYWVQRFSNATPLSGTAVSMADTAPTADRYNLSICEILAASSGGPTTWSISGAITPASGGNGATVTSSGAGTASTTADASGNYSFSGLGNGSYSITPTKAGYTFTPPSQPATVNGGNVTAVNFTAQAVQTTWSISGSISPVAGGAGATVTLSGTAAQTTTTDGSGNYTFSGVSNGAYTVTPSKGGFTFAPPSQAVTINSASASGVNFTDQSTTSAGIQLVQKNVNGNESTGSSIAASFLSSNTAGNFIIVTGTAARPSSTLSISDTAGNTYSPAIGPVTDTAQNVTAYIWYVPNCKAGPNTVTITPSSASALEIHISEWVGIAGSSPVDQISSANGTGTSASSGIKTTVADGELVFGYTFLFNTAAAGAGFSGMSLVNGDLDEYQIQSSAGPIAATFTQTSGTWFALMATFRPAGGGGTPGPWSVSGVISPSAGGSGATVALSGAATAMATADGSGNYTFAGLNNGSYTVTPSKSGYTFTPPNQAVTLNGSNAGSINFTAQASLPAIISLDVNTSADKSTASTTVASPSFSTGGVNELLLAFIAADYKSGANTTVTSVAGGGLTWALVSRANVQSGTSEIWRAFSAGQLTSVSVTATLSQSVVSSITVMSFTGVDTSGTNGSGAIGATASGNASRGAPTASLTTTRNNSWVVGVGNDFDNALSRTVGANQALVHQYLAATGDTYWVQMQSAATPSSGTLVTLNDTAPTSDRYNLSICEILPASTGGGGGGGDTTPPTVSMVSPAPGAVVSKLAVLWASASDNVAVSGVQFLIDGLPSGSQITSQPYTLTWDTSTVADGTHTVAALARDTAGLTTTSTPVTIKVDNSGNSAVVGSWSSVVSIPTVAVNLILLKNNKVLFYEDGLTPTVWDYVNSTFTNVSTSADLFCSGHGVMADGRVLVVGGYGGSGNNIGIANAEIFDPSNNTWTAVPNMAYKRWYPTATTLSDGRVLVTAGWQTTNHSNAGIPEIYDPTTNKWTQLTTANNPFETYPFIYLLPDGRLIHVGGSEYATVTDILDLTTQTWSVVDPNIVDGGSPAMYLPGKIMKAGSAADSQNVGPSANTTYVLDMTSPSPAWKQTPSMAYPRSFMNLTTLPDGTVLATGGETDKDGGKIANAVYAAELWSPQTQTWTTMAAMHTPREYHSTAVLLPDGRVLVSGMGADFGNVPDETNAEFYSPPYLFKGTRPTITGAPAQMQYGTNVFVGTPDATSIASVALIRTGAVTHFFDKNARFVPLSFQQASGGLTVTAPATANLAPPGYYMLFIVNNAGVPSVAPFVKLTQ